MLDVARQILSLQFLDGFHWDEVHLETPSDGGSKTVADSGGGGSPAPPEGAFVMVEAGWFHEGHHTNSHRKGQMNRM
jgi:hypothetical protein